MLEFLSTMNKVLAGVVGGVLFLWLLVVAFGLLSAPSNLSVVGGVAIIGALLAVVGAIAQRIKGV